MNHADRQIEGRQRLVLQLGQIDDVPGLDLALNLTEALLAALARLLGQLQLLGDALRQHQGRRFEVARQARLDRGVQRGVLVAAEVVQRPRLLRTEQPALAERALVHVHGDGETDAELVVPEGQHLLQLALHPGDAALEQRRVDVRGCEGLQPRRVELVDLLAAVRAQVLDQVQQRARGNVQRELLRGADQLQRVAGLLQRQTDERRLRGERHMPRHRQHVVGASIVRGDERDRPAEQDAGRDRRRTALDSIGRMLDHGPSIGGSRPVTPRPAARSAPPRARPPARTPRSARLPARPRRR